MYPKNDLRCRPAATESNHRHEPLEAHANPADRATTVAVTLAQSVTERLRAALLEGRFAPDEKLNEASLSTMLAVSRTPVRSALHSLVAEGLLDYVPNRGYSVRGVDVEGLGPLFDVRGVLEGLASRSAAERGLSDAAHAAYREALADGDAVLGKGQLLIADRAIFGDVNSRIHAAIVQAAENRMLQDMIRLCHNIPASSDRNVLWDDYHWLRRSHDDHHRMLEAIVLRDAARAEQLMREHIHTVKLKHNARVLR